METPTVHYVARLQQNAAKRTRLKEQKVCLFVGAFFFCLYQCVTMTNQLPVKSTSFCKGFPLFFLIVTVNYFGHTLSLSTLSQVLVFAQQNFKKLIFSSLRECRKKPISLEQKQVKHWEVK